MCVVLCRMFTMGCLLTMCGMYLRDVVRCYGSLDLLPLGFLVWVGLCEL